MSGEDTTTNKLHIFKTEQHVAKDNQYIDSDSATCGLVGVGCETMTWQQIRWQISNTEQHVARENQVIATDLIAYGRDKLGCETTTRHQESYKCSNWATRRQRKPRDIHGLSCVCADILWCETPPDRLQIFETEQDVAKENREIASDTAACGFVSAGCETMTWQQISYIFSRLSNTSLAKSGRQPACPLPVG